MNKKSREFPFELHIPVQTCHQFRLKTATTSGSNQASIPIPLRHYWTIAFERSKLTQSTQAA
ncbi:hypothetical protein EBB_04940 [Methylomonas sp. EbB]|uniref:Uncharacterized protein n=1 Tax=Methylomonas fluvii TaxID=1854564 RepID=A0ABR9DC69_9GAMM|nr:hypothetical protein [Methylomonas fluvii]MBD9359903.1 hypothetical protein [Methylomonas fluvii]CAD6872677.1 hypothetical protein [Methylomonas fluvii]